MEEKKRRKRAFVYRAEIIGIFLLSAAALVIGSSVVSVNCYNTMNSTPMVLFNVEHKGEDIIITYMDKEYIIGQRPQPSR